MDKPLVSIVIPAYYGERFLDATIESVVRQTYPHWELIIVDDNSKDGTAALVKRWTEKDKRILYVYHPVNRGMASARNAGITMSHGEYIALLDQDNLFLPNKLEMQVTYMEAHPECGLSYAKILHFYDGAPEVLYTNKNEAPFLGKDLFRECLYKNFINVLAVLIRKEAFDKFGAFQPGWYACDEQYVWVNLSYHGVKFCYLDEVVGHLRLHPTSDSARGDYLIRSATYFFKMFDIVESWLTPEQKIVYGPDLAALRRRWRIRSVIGKLMVTPPFSWLLVPLFLTRRDRNFVKIEDAGPGVH